VPATARGGRFDVALAWFPVVGALLGLLLAAADLALRAVDASALVNSVALVVLLLLLSGALHADGLMDTCDAAFVPASPARRLEILHDPHVGAFGVVGLVAVILLKVAAVEALPTSLRSVSLILGPTLGRWAIVLAAAWFPSARPDGSGVLVQRAASARRVLLATLVAVAVSGHLWPIGPALALVAALGTWLLGRWLSGLLTGLTGDCYGAICEVTEALVWLVIAPLSHALG
jgi:adenosylcobinamide-GDP ribazoletransferase